MPTARHAWSGAASGWSGPDVGPLELGGAENAPHKTKARLQQSGSVNYGRSVSQTVLTGEAVLMRSAWRPAAHVTHAMRHGVRALGVRSYAWLCGGQARKLSAPVKSPGGSAPRAAKAALRAASPSSSGKSCRRVMKRMIDVVS